MRRMIFFFLFFALPALSAVHLDSVEPEKILTPELTGQPHILFLNVNKAITDEALADAAAYVRLKYMFNTLTNACETSQTRDVIDNPALLRQRFGKMATLVVAFERNDSPKPAFIALPGHYTALNTAPLTRDNPPADLLAKRTRQMALKGLAHAAGIGANADEHCVMYYKSFTLSGMDATSATYGPFAYLPIRETLRLLGGDAIFSPLYL